MDSPAMSRFPRRRAFTLVELLVVVGIIVLIVALILSIIPQIRRQSMSTVCLSNQRQLNIGFNQYFTDNSGRFMGVDTGLTAWDWVQGQSNLNGQGFETENALKKGRMWAYIGRGTNVGRAAELAGEHDGKDTAAERDHRDEP